MRKSRENGIQSHLLIFSLIHQIFIGHFNGLTLDILGFWRGMRESLPSRGAWSGWGGAGGKSE